mgnify:CR=1 FL=1
MLGKYLQVSIVEFHFGQYQLSNFKRVESTFILHDRLLLLSLVKWKLRPSLSHLFDDLEYQDLRLPFPSRVGLLSRPMIRVEIFIRVGVEGGYSGASE